MQEITYRNLYEIKQEIEEWFKNIKSYKLEIGMVNKQNWDSISDCIYVESNPINIEIKHFNIIIDVENCKYYINVTDKIKISENEIQHNISLLYSENTIYRFTKLK